MGKMRTGLFFHKVVVFFLKNKEDAESRSQKIRRGMWFLCQKIGRLEVFRMNEAGFRA